MSLTIKGSREFLSTGAVGPLFQIAGLSFLGVERQKGPTYGEQWVFTFESAASNDPSIASPAETAYHRCPLEFVSKLTAIGPKHQLTISAPVEPNGNAAALSAVATQYELLGNALQLDLREHPKALALGPDRIAIIDSVLNKEAGFTATSVTDGLSGQSKTDAQMLYDLLRQRNGNAAFQKSQYVFRYIFVTNRLSEIGVTYAGAEKLYTTAQMTAETGAPVGVLEAIGDAVTNSTPSTVPTGYFFGWLKQTPTVTVSANNKLQISGEFWLEIWSTWVYTTV